LHGSPAEGVGVWFVVVLVIVVVVVTLVLVLVAGCAAEALVVGVVVLVPAGGGEVAAPVVDGGARPGSGGLGVVVVGLVGVGVGAVVGVDADVGGEDVPRCLAGPACGLGIGVRARASCVRKLVTRGGVVAAATTGLNGPARARRCATRWRCAAPVAPPGTIGAAAMMAPALRGFRRRRWCETIGVATASPTTAAIVAVVTSAWLGEIRACAGVRALPPSAVTAVCGSALSVAHAAIVRLPA
jgi:hypothetical protein